MKNIILFLLILVPGTAQAKVHQKVKTPHIVSEREGFDRCSETDHACCPGRLVTVQNPTKRPIDAYVECDGIEEHAPIAPGSTIQFDLGRGDRPTAPGCVLVWNFTK